MKYLKMFENLDPLQKGDYIILETTKNFHFLIKIIEKNNINSYTYTLYFEQYNSFKYESIIYYDYKINNFYFTADNILKTSWQGKDEKEAIKKIEIYNSVNKYNL